MPTLGSEHRLICHIDMDCFYASVEMAKNPELRGTPVIVSPDPKQGKGRGVVLTCSYEARALGVRIAMPVSKAYKICPEGNYCRSDRNAYQKVSNKIMDLLETFADNGYVRQTSIDEAYLDVTHTAKAYETPIHLAREIQWHIWRQEEVTCSIGLAPNMSVAKIAANQQKPHGITWVKAEDVVTFLSPLPVSAISGIGRVRSQELVRKGYNTIGDLQALSRQVFMRQFGKEGVWLWNRMHGIDNRPLKGQRHGSRKSMSHNWTFPEDIKATNRQKLEESLGSMVEKLGKRLAKYALSYRTISLTVRTSDFRTRSRSFSLPTPHRDEQTIQNYLNKALRELVENTTSIRMLGVALSNLGSTKGQTTLWRWLTA